MDGASLKEDTLEAAKMATFGGVFSTNGLPRLVIMDDVRLFKGVLMEMLKPQKLTCMAVAPKNHWAVRIETFFCYLNKS